MKLLTQDIRTRLLANGRNRDVDHAPVVKLFNPVGAATWLITEMDPEEPDILFGLCDFGMHCPELGSVRLSELEGTRLRFGLGIERDLYFKAAFPLSVYAEAARIAGHITQDPEALATAAAACAERAS